MMGIEPQYIYLGATTVLAILQIINYRKIESLKSEIGSVWQQIAIMAIASAGAFDKLEKKIDEKEEKK
jgi:hypothetical protein